MFFFSTATKPHPPEEELTKETIHQGSFQMRAVGRGRILTDSKSEFERHRKP